MCRFLAGFSEGSRVWVALFAAEGIVPGSCAVFFLDEDSGESRYPS